MTGARLQVGRPDAHWYVVAPKDDAERQRARYLVGEAMFDFVKTEASTPISEDAYHMGPATVCEEFRPTHVGTLCNRPGFTSLPDLGAKRLPLGLLGKIEAALFRIVNDDGLQRVGGHGALTLENLWCNFDDSTVYIGPPRVLVDAPNNDMETATLLVQALYNAHAPLDRVVGKKSIWANTAPGPDGNRRRRETGDDHDARGESQAFHEEGEVHVNSDVEEFVAPNNAPLGEIGKAEADAAANTVKEESASKKSNEGGLGSVEIGPMKHVRSPDGALTPSVGSATTRTQTISVEREASAFHAFTASNASAEAPVAKRRNPKRLTVDSNRLSDAKRFEQPEKCMFPKDDRAELFPSSSCSSLGLAERFYTRPPTGPCFCYATECAAKLGRKVAKETAEEWTAMAKEVEVAQEKKYANVGSVAGNRNGLIHLTDNGKYRFIPHRKDEPPADDPRLSVKAAEGMAQRAFKLFKRWESWAAINRAYNRAEAGNPLGPWKTFTNPRSEYYNKTLGTPDTLINCFECFKPTEFTDNCAMGGVKVTGYDRQVLALLCYRNVVKLVQATAPIDTDGRFYFSCQLKKTQWKVLGTWTDSSKEDNIAAAKRGQSKILKSMKEEWMIKGSSPNNDHTVVDSVPAAWEGKKYANWHPVYLVPSASGCVFCPRRCDCRCATSFIATEIVSVLLRRLYPHGGGRGSATEKPIRISTIWQLAGAALPQGAVLFDCGSGRGDQTNGAALASSITAIGVEFLLHVAVAAQNIAEIVFIMLKNCLRGSAIGTVITMHGDMLQLDYTDDQVRNLLPPSPRAQCLPPRTFDKHAIATNILMSDIVDRHAAKLLESSKSPTAEEKAGQQRGSLTVYSMLSLREFGEAGFAHTRALVDPLTSSWTQSRHFHSDWAWNTYRNAKPPQKNGRSRSPWQKKKNKKRNVVNDDEVIVID